MIVTTTQTIAFKIPEDMNAEREFKKNNGNKYDWVVKMDSNYIYYTHTETYANTQGDADERGDNGKD